ncbi:hypothetical protein [Glycomyces harbinensis]|uniref:Uncharacterized protein n=1 Tax=Glycomyces harbinensis TaxID=58114 RepID=A0A1G6ZAI4_9ACTN|nr:hypothetical protein [Glycomyces harbinensis]SDD99610.1 hypothetical protein SAMN05216270_110144 [Glycomyces harbinensis]
MKPARLFKKLGAAVAVGLVMLGIIAGTASAANADGTSGEVNSGTPSTEIIATTATSGEVN